MNIDWQPIITGILIAWAFGYILWRGWRMAVLKKSGGCGSCAKCPSNTPDAKNFVQLEPMLGSVQKKR